MKQIICILLLLLSYFAKAQNFRAEITAGIAGSQVSGDQLGGFNKAGILAGAGIRTGLGGDFDLGFRIQYFQKGSRKPVKAENLDSGFYLLRLNYMELPLTLRYHFSKNFYMEAGPSLGYLLKSTEEDENGIMNFRQTFYRFDLSLCGAFGYALTKELDFQFGAWQSLLPIREHGSGQVYRLNRGQYSSVVSFSLLYTFRPKKESEENKQASR
ncbi:MAG: PorT family protein [Bacteroidia bacterium]|nr:PorT family protein [Bacteroidia bacterium]